MRVIPADGLWLEEAVQILREGGVVAHATETCYGLACDMGNPAAVAKLFAVKERPVGQPVSALFVSVEEAKDYVEWNEQAETLAKEGLPGPLTLILPLREDAPVKLFPTPGGGTTVGVRVSPNFIATALADAFGKPITTTSANVHGLPNPYSAETILTQFSQKKEQPDVLIDSGTLPQNPPSRVLDLTGNVQKTVR
jgi:L-threonylcarbamoyladenylate synthase